MFRDLLSSSSGAVRRVPTWLKVLIPLIAIGGLAVLGVMAFVTVFIITAWFGNPIPLFGFDQSPDQPIEFPHTVHAGTALLLDHSGSQRVDGQGDELRGLGLDCTFCHRTVDKIGSAGVPPVQQCVFCHKVIGEPGNTELAKLRATSLDAETARPINWRRVHRLPDHVRFVHEPHIRFLTAHPDSIKNSIPQLLSDGTVDTAQVCATCHGDVAAMTKVKQVESLKMGQCVDCHRDNEAPTDCATCHH